MRLLRSGQIRYKSSKFFYLTINELKKVCVYFVGRIDNQYNLLAIQLNNHTMHFPIEIAPDTYLIASYAEMILCSHFAGRFEVNQSNQLIFKQS